MQVAPAGDAKALGVQRVGMLATAREDADVGDLRQMTGEEAADHAGADDADAFDHDASLYRR